jgi:hypothetical protein
MTPRAFAQSEAGLYQIVTLCPAHSALKTIHSKTRQIIRALFSDRIAWSKLIILDPVWRRRTTGNAIDAIQPAVQINIGAAF